MLSEPGARRGFEADDSHRIGSCLVTDLPSAESRGRSPLFIVALAAAIVILAVLTYTNDWLGLRPATGTAVAMAEASEPAPNANRIE